MYQNYSKKYLKELIKSGQANLALEYCLCEDNEDLYNDICDELENEVNITWNLLDQIKYINITYGWHDYKGVWL